MATTRTATAPALVPPPVDFSATWPAVVVVSSDVVVSSASVSVVNVLDVVDDTREVVVARDVVLVGRVVVVVGRVVVVVLTTTSAETWMTPCI